MGHCTSKSAILRSKGEVFRPPTYTDTTPTMPPIYSSDTFTAAQAAAVTARTYNTQIENDYNKIIKSIQEECNMGYYCLHVESHTLKRCRQKLIDNGYKIMNNFIIWGDICTIILPPSSTTYGFTVCSTDGYQPYIIMDDVYNLMVNDVIISIDGNLPSYYDKLIEIINAKREGSSNIEVTVCRKPSFK